MRQIINARSKSEHHRYQLDAPPVLMLHRLAEGHVHRSLGQRPRNVKSHANQWLKVIFTRVTVSLFMAFSHSDSGSHNGYLATADRFSLAWRPWNGYNNSDDTGMTYSKVDLQVTETDCQVKGKPFDSRSFARCSANSNNKKINYNVASATVNLAATFDAPNTNEDC